MDLPLSEESRFRHVVFEGKRVVARAAAARQSEPKPSAPYAGPPLSAEEGAFFRWVLGKAGLSVARYRHRPLQRRLSACLRALKVSTLAEARWCLERQPELMDTALNALIIGTTEFFRDAAVFEHLRCQVLPELLQSSRGVRAWSVGCSEGAELYSLAILLAEAGALERCELLGTDCRPQALQRAAAGWFDAEMLKSIEPALRARYFRSDRQGRYRVVPSLAGRMRWQGCDVFGAGEEQAWDLILCRNLAIYLEIGAVSELWRRLVGALRPGGVLVVGKAEKPAGLSELVRLAPCIYQKPGEETA